MLRNDQLLQEVLTLLKSDRTDELLTSILVYKKETFIWKKKCRRPETQSQSKMESLIDWHVNAIYK